ncbi:MAG: DUF3427 domain-containing protein, partial [Candidatus Sericytochromatia bacterium]|nr:DUF3427 domain-containing protein [Candidatus Tanganyikabacteria bacterium]
LSQLQSRVDDIGKIRALGFCVSIAHARFMARVFEDAGVAATAVWGDSPEEDRRHALRDLASGKVQIVFSVDLFNEGVDVPVVDTLLLLRPTDSPTLFLQQLGRGLRLSPGKTVCTVLDFVGNHRSEFRFDRRFRALLGGSRKDLIDQLERGFPFLPAGCHLDLDPVAREIVLSNVKQGVPSRWTAKVAELRHLGDKVSLRTFLTKTGIDLEDVYIGNKSWSDLRQDAGLLTSPTGPCEATLRRACGRLLHIDDLLRIDSYRRFLQAEAPPGELPVRETRLLRMLLEAVAGEATEKGTTLAQASDLLWSHPQVRRELLELLDVLGERESHLHQSLETHPEVPLQVHARYTRREILAAFGLGDGVKTPQWREGVKWVKEAGADLLAFTLDKTDGQFSPTTRYRDYAISRRLIHWESQSTTRADSETGRRYQSCESAVMLFARLRSDDRAFWFLGPARYVAHEGELPMAIKWSLDHILPGDLYAEFAAAVA